MNRSVLYILTLMLVIFLFPSVSFAAPTLSITEIMYDAPGTDTGREWIEVYNAGEPIDLVDIRLKENEVNHKITSHDGVQITQITNGEYVIIADNPAKFIVDYPTYSGKLFDSAFSLNNTGEGLSLTSGETVLDSVFYTPDLGAVGDGHSLQLNSAVFTPAKPTPGKENTTEQLPADSSGEDSAGGSSGTSTSSTSGSSSSSSSSSSKTSANSTHGGQVGLSTYEPKVFKIGAGRTRYSNINTPVHFELFSDQSDTLTSRSVTWSFGDGESGRGKSITHSYVFPGTYNVVANLKTDTATAVSRTKIIVTEPFLDVSVSATSSMVSIYNDSNSEVNIGEFGLQINSVQKSLAKDTIIDPFSSIMLPIARYSVDPNIYSVILYYPNGEIVDAWYNEYVKEHSIHLYNWCFESGYCDQKKLDHISGIL